jgi:hypothetical protein
MCADSGVTFVYGMYNLVYCTSTEVRDEHMHILLLLLILVLLLLLIIIIMIIIRQR